MGDARHANESISHPYQPTACTDDEHYIRLIRHVFPINLIVLLYTIPSGPMNVPRVEKTQKKTLLRLPLVSAVRPLDVVVSFTHVLALDRFIHESVDKKKGNVPSHGELTPFYTFSARWMEK